MPAYSSPRILSSLDDAVGLEAESMILTGRRKKLLRGVAIGIVRDGESFLRFYGEGVGPGSRFELGSLTKVYTAELLAKLVERGTVRLEDPVALYLDQDNGAHPVTLLDLVTHYSSEPRLPPGVSGLSRNPYARYTHKNLEQYLRKRPLQRPADAQFRTATSATASSATLSRGRLARAMRNCCNARYCSRSR